MKITGKKDVLKKLQDYKDINFRFDYMKKDRIVYVGTQGDVKGDVIKSVIEGVFMIISFKVKEEPYYIHLMTMDKILRLVDEDTILLLNDKS